MSRSDAARHLRESVQTLREYVFSASSYPGPEPGKLTAINVNYPGSAGAQRMRDKDEVEAARKKVVLKKKRAGARRNLRKLSVWLQQKQKR